MAVFYPKDPSGDEMLQTFKGRKSPIPTPTAARLKKTAKPNPKQGVNRGRNGTEDVPYKK